MAGSAETQTFYSQTPDIFVDSIPAVAEVRAWERAVATDLLETRRAHFSLTGEVDFLPVDALSTAESVLLTELAEGQRSEEYQEKWNGLVLDCQRLVGEWYRKKKPEYFPPVRHEFNQDKEEFFSHGLSIRQMTENALTPITNDIEEESRRVNERVEEATPHLLRSLGAIAIGTQSIRTISECTDSALQSYAHDQKIGAKHRGYRGYVPEIEKVMIRDIRLDSESDDRFEEQIGLPGIFITHDIFQMTLEKRGLNAANMDKTELHGSQILASDDLLDFVRDLDDTASKEWDVQVFMGEEVPTGFVKDYANFRLEALERQESLRDHAETVALFVLDLAREGFDKSKAPEHVENFVKSLLLNVAKVDGTVAEQMFDKQTALGLQEVASLEQQGRFEEAQIKWAEVERSAPGGGSCGGGSCGLESVAGGSSEDKALRKEMGADEGDTVVKDKERSCRCGSKSVVYAYNKQKVIKYCTSCSATEKTYKKVA